MNQSLKDSKVLIVGTSSSVAQYDKKFLQEKRENGYKILSYSGNSLIYLYDIGFKPDFFIFFRPFCLYYWNRKYGGAMQRLAKGNDIYRV